MKTTIRNIALIGLSCLGLMACQTSQSVNQSNSIDGAIDRAAYKASNNGQSLSYLERQYKKNSSDEVIATNFAEGLRKNGDELRAATVLAPFANKKAASTETKTEYAAIQLAQGNFKAAEGFARDAIDRNDGNFEAYQYLGIALDGQEEYEPAETAFRQSLDLWQGNPTTIMNNLALNLAAQEKLDEAEEILEKAKSLSPGRVELERNLRIVRALKESSSYSYSSASRDMPRPSMKPNS